MPAFSNMTPEYGVPRYIEVGMILVERVGSIPRVNCLHLGRRRRIHDMGCTGHKAQGISSRHEGLRRLSNGYDKVRLRGYYSPCCYACDLDLSFVQSHNYLKWSD